MPLRETETTEKISSGNIPEAEKKTAYDFFKRVSDVIISIIALIVLMPVLLIISLIIVADDFGNPVFIQERVGKNGKIFRMFKFRTMYKNAEEVKHTLHNQNESDGIHFKMKDDPRITRAGKIIRKTSLDELPQLLNIIKGDMSIIGPRPFIPEEQSQLPDDRLSVLPGLSCFWQIADRNALNIEEQLELDYKYIRERSLMTDIRLIFRTIAVVLTKNNF